MNLRREWLAGLVVGAWAGFLLVEGFVIGALLFAAFAIPAGFGRSQAAVGGLLAGTGVGLLLILAVANANCAGNFGVHEGSCTPPDLTGLLVAGSVMGTAGAVLTVRAINTSRRR